MIVLRFAPSPTGNLHIGGARTALYNWIFCRQNKGKFILRIDDTDSSRNKANSIDSIINDLQWLGIDWDIGPKKNDPKDFQSSYRKDIYIQYANVLLNKQLAYTDNNGAIILKVDSNSSDTITFNDQIQGKISIKKNTMKDIVLIRKNGIATYNFATVIDDYLMKVSHIFRANEHLLNTPKQILIYQAFNWNIPIFGHMGIITDLSGKKLSKRSGDYSVNYFKNMGILSAAMVNFLSFLGWGDNNQGKLLSINDLIKSFSINKVKKSNSCFDLKLLLSINKKYINLITIDDLSIILKYTNIDYLKYFHKVFLNRSTTINDLIQYHNKISSKKIDYDLSILKYNKKDIIDCLDFIIKNDINNISMFTDQKLISNILRFVILGNNNGPSNNDLIYLSSFYKNLTDKCIVLRQLLN